MEAESLPMIEVDGGRIAYRRIGNGRPLVVLNGFAATSADWDPSFIDVLASSNELILVDNRGIGSSTDNGRPFGIDQLADDAARVIEMLDVERPSVLGWSMGGFIAQKLALQPPDRINKLILLSTDREELTQISRHPKSGQNSSTCPARLMNRRTDCCHWFFRTQSPNPVIANSAIS